MITKNLICVLILLGWKIQQVQGAAGGLRTRYLEGYEADHETYNVKVQLIQGPGEQQQEEPEDREDSTSTSETIIVTTPEGDNTAAAAAATPPDDSPANIDDTTTTTTTGLNEEETTTTVNEDEEETEETTTIKEEEEETAGSGAGSIGPPPPLPAPPSNDICVHAQPLTVSTRGLDGMPAEFVAEGTTVGATNQNLQPCPHRRSRHSSPMVWYSVVGTGSELTATTCFPGTTFDTKISIMAGTTSDCGNDDLDNSGAGLTCIAYNDDAANPSCGEDVGEGTNGFASRVSWDTDWGVTYYIVVHAYNAQEVGPFQIAVVGRNDWCTLASGMTEGETRVGDTSKTQFNLRDVLAQCGYQERDYHGEWHRGPWDHQPRGQWYKIVGTGQRFQATTCPGTFYAHRIHVFTGDCIYCLGGEDQPRQCVTYEWDTIPGQIYTVVVHRAYPGYDTTVTPKGGLPAQFASPPGPSSPAPFNLSIREVGGYVVTNRQYEDSFLP